ncbi:MAG: hypothetical protein COV55_00635 [Candidatus Komeilibacteria bacterium CG11_big_fil_rev_8_21_14_0_20_36_20]|uniref:Uncharacterized protein n=1 Tax=Candidatus Komeilibacteria bacterium CG11_big_fil_rev_8_21_14_0_20_36_20 TaxID=1974477 RepID=A0A2H0NEE6_9BACT|nr:MAG: hypothetical protein COV55_00635 [Candidatus Komeilibacteria bacterium CG11_big_fil_rev_8_21_14_0_20_36_20]PIR81689.1 MAG: hypothetical protein COU21_02490 [Candidatus Komeilibacteria bacterium CG10_big_fil_rev_8_21_14_0_10_36_65]PJC55620.1 MAG: hypothetical protein CO027_01300 [Candidatus Komeilibacteria bacterium CG_4_9_14_0_2_um_filter_36_13]
MVGHSAINMLFIVTSGSTLELIRKQPTLKITENKHGFNSLKPPEKCKRGFLYLKRRELLFKKVYKLSINKLEKRREIR